MCQLFKTAEHVLKQELEQETMRANKEAAIVDFYADPDNWSVSKFSAITVRDLSPREDKETVRKTEYTEYNIGGTLARLRQKQRGGCEAHMASAMPGEGV